jgi:hypothetical protein
MRGSHDLPGAIVPYSYQRIYHSAGNARVPPRATKWLAYSPHGPQLIYDASMLFVGASDVDRYLDGRM